MKLSASQLLQLSNNGHVCIADAIPVREAVQLDFASREDRPANALPLVKQLRRQFYESVLPLANEWRREWGQSELPSHENYEDHVAVGQFFTSIENEGVAKPHMPWEHNKTFPLMMLVCVTTNLSGFGAAVRMCADYPRGDTKLVEIAYREAIVFPVGRWPNKKAGKVNNRTFSYSVDSPQKGHQTFLVLGA